METEYIRSLVILHLDNGEGHGIQNGFGAGEILHAINELAGSSEHLSELAHGEQEHEES